MEGDKEDSSFTVKECERSISGKMNSLLWSNGEVWTFLPCSRDSSISTTYGKRFGLKVFQSFLNCRRYTTILHTYSTVGKFRRKRQVATTATLSDFIERTLIGCWWP